MEIRDLSMILEAGQEALITREKTALEEMEDLTTTNLII